MGFPEPLNQEGGVKVNPPPLGGGWKTLDQSLRWGPPPLGLELEGTRLALRRRHGTPGARGRGSGGCRRVRKKRSTIPGRPKKNNTTKFKEFKELNGGPELGGGEVGDGRAGARFGGGGILSYELGGGEGLQRVPVAKTISSALARSSACDTERHDGDHGIPQPV